MSIDNAEFLQAIDPDYGRARWWAENYPGFTPEQCECLEAYTWGAGPKEIKRAVTKSKLCRDRPSSSKNARSSG